MSTEVPSRYVVIREHASDDIILVVPDVQYDVKGSCIDSLMSEHCRSKIFKVSCV